MHDAPESAGPVLRLFEVRVKPGCAEALLKSFATTSAEVVTGAPGNLGHFFGQGLSGDEDTLMFASLWTDLDAIKTRFGAAWQESFLPAGYEEMIDEHGVRHVDMTSGWRVP